MNNLSKCSSLKFVNFHGKLFHTCDAVHHVDSVNHFISAVQISISKISNTCLFSILSATIRFVEGLEWHVSSGTATAVQICFIGRARESIRCCVLGGWVGLRLCWWCSVLAGANGLLCGRLLAFTSKLPLLWFLRWSVFLGTNCQTNSLAYFPGAIEVFSWSICCRWICSFTCQLPDI